MVGTAIAGCGPVGGTEAVSPGDEPGKFDKVVPKETTVELKVNIDAKEIGAALAALELVKSKAERRWVTFYDTPELTLYGQGLLLRSRKVADDDDDTTVKVRPLDAAKVASSWFAVKKFKCEIDRTGAKSVSSCSLTKDCPQGEIDEVADGERTIKQLFTDEQESFASIYGGGEPAWSELRALGPTDAWVWELVSSSGLELTVELWEQGSLRLLEVSTKEKESKAAAAEKQLLQDLAALGLEPSATGDTKTKAVLTTLTSPAAGE